MFVLRTQTQVLFLYYKEKEIYVWFLQLSLPARTNQYVARYEHQTEHAFNCCSPNELGRVGDCVFVKQSEKCFPGVVLDSSLCPLWHLDFRCRYAGILSQ